MGEQHVNRVILKSIPIDKELKRYFLRKFRKMERSNGRQFACDKMKHLREVALAYRADIHRCKRVERYLRQTGFRTDGWLRKLFRYLDCAPAVVLQFLKLYCGPSEPIVTVGQAGEAQHRALSDARKVNCTTPEFLIQWLEMVLRKRLMTSEQYLIMKCFPDQCPSWMLNYVKNHSYEEYREYARHWKSLLWVKPVADDDDELTQRLANRTPCADMYVDFGTGPRRMDKSSQSFQDDIRNFIAMEQYVDIPDFLTTFARASDDESAFKWGWPGITRSNYEFVKGLLDNRSSILLDSGDENPLRGGNALDGTYVGQIHHIPKKGTVKRRSVAPPNRFIQLGFVPADLQLERLLKKLGKARDCTYDQTRLNRYIQNRVNNDNLYCGSVDLHQATDFLPFQWMKDIWRIAFDGRVQPMVEQSWDLFCHASQGAWLNVGYRDRWTTGQPLGAYPSFKCLGITHNLVVEALCFLMGVGHSPYAVLGDDIVIMNKKVRKAYIVLMNNAGVPLSLHKSYEGRLVEFAGQIFIKNHAPFYNTDHKALTWNSLFDYQWATGIDIPAEHLPKKLQRKIKSLVRKKGGSRDSWVLAYELARYWGSQPRGSHVSSTGSNQCLESYLPLMAEIVERTRDSKVRPDRRPWSGISMVPGGHVVSFGKRQYANKDGYFMEYRPVDQWWFTQKVRPASTDSVIAAATLAILAGQQGVTAKAILG